MAGTKQRSSIDQYASRAVPEPCRYRHVRAVGQLGPALGVDRGRKRQQDGRSVCWSQFFHQWNSFVQLNLKGDIFCFPLVIYILDGAQCLACALGIQKANTAGCW